MFEYSPRVAKGAFDLDLGLTHATTGGLHHALCRICRSIDETKHLDVLRCHLDLDGKLAQAKRLIAESTSVQASTGRDALTDEERATFEDLSSCYSEALRFRTSLLSVG